MLGSALCCGYPSWDSRRDPTSATVVLSAGRFVRGVKIHSFQAKGETPFGPPAPSKRMEKPQKAVLGLLHFWRKPEDRLSWSPTF